MAPVSHDHPSARRTEALLMLVVANFFWGISFPVIKTIELLHVQLMPEAGTWFSATYTVAPRFLLSVGVLVLWRPTTFWRVTRGELKQGLVIGVFAAIGMLFQNDALQFTAASTSAFLTQFYAIAIPVYLALRARRNPGWLVWVCCGLVLAGVAILGNFSWRELRFGRGEAETLLASLFFMGQILWLEKKEFAANRASGLTLVMFSTEALIFAILALALAPGTHALVAPWHSPGWVGLTVGLTIFCTLGSYTIMNAWQPKITATEAGLIYCIEPIFASVMALFLPGWFSAWTGVTYDNERVSGALIVGGILITLANVLLQFRPPSKAAGVS